MKMKNSIAVTLVLMLVLASIDVSFTPSAKAVAAGSYLDVSEYESLAEIYKDYFRIGSAITNNDLGTPEKEKAVLNLFNSITCENDMKPAYSFNPNSEDLFTISSGAEKTLTWADQHDYKMRAHVLVWHSQVNPAIFVKDFVALSDGKKTASDTAWLDEDCLVDAETLKGRLKSYIYSMIEYTYVNGFADNIYAWDVVNEAMDEGQPDSLRRSTWYRILGPDFLYYSFLYAREAVVKFSHEYASVYGLDAATDDLSEITPKLMYNDYNEWFPKRVKAIINYMTEYKFNENQSMVESDVIKEGGDGTIFGDGLIDAVGMQGHINDTQNIKDYISALEQYSAAIGEVHITELDIGCTSFDENQWYKQAQYFYDFFNALLEAKRNGANLTSVTFWGLTDASSWRSSEYPLMLNKDLSLKPAYVALTMAGKGEEFNISLAQTISELKDTFIDFEPYKEGGSTVTVDYRSVGILPRGAGHKPTIMLKGKINHTADATPGYAVQCTRDAVDANIKVDVSKYCGRNITVTMFVKTDDAYVRVGFDADESVAIINKPMTKADENGWAEIKFNVDVPDEKSAFLFVETDGTATIYLDDISIVYTRDDEVPPVIEDEDLVAESTGDIISNESAGSEVSGSESAEADVATEEKTDSGSSTNLQDAGKPSEGSSDSSESAKKPATGSESNSDETEESGSNLVAPGAIACLLLVSAGSILYSRNRRKEREENSSK